jgi:hypothetical protein
VQAWLDDDPTDWARPQAGPVLGPRGSNPPRLDPSEMVEFALATPGLETAEPEEIYARMVDAKVAGAPTPITVAAEDGGAALGEFDVDRPGKITRSASDGGSGLRGRRGGRKTVDRTRRMSAPN